MAEVVSMQEVSSAQHSIGLLFKLVDQDNDRYLDFGEVTALFKKLAPHQPTQSAQNAAVEALLMSDKNADSRLNRREFEEMLLKVAELSGVPLDEAAERLLEVTQQQQQQQQQPAGSSHQAAADVHVPAAVAAEAAAPGPGSEAAAAADQLQQLFQLWDKAGDGRISFAELCQGLGKMRQPIKHKKDITSLIQEAGGVLAAHDSDGDRQLDFGEFSGFMAAFMAAAGFQLQEVVADLVTLAQTKPDNEKLQRVLDAAQPQIHRMLSR